MKIRITALIVVAVLMVFGTFTYGQQAMIDRAVDAAATKTINDLTRSSQTAGIKSIAFFGLKGGEGHYSSLFQAAMAKSSSRFTFYTRDEKLWDKLVGEIEFGEKREDVMSKESVQKFGKISGVQAYMYGRVLEADINSDGNAVFRVSLTLSEVETGRFIWGGQITGVSRKVSLPIKVPMNVLQAAIDAGKKLNDDLMFQKTSLPECNIFVVPFLGEDAKGLFDPVISEIKRNFGTKVSFYADPDKLDFLRLDDIKSDINGNTPTYTSKQLTELMQKLQQAYNTNPNAIMSGKFGKDKVNAYLQVIVTNVERLKEGGFRITRIAINAQLRDLSNNRLLWSKNVIGEYKQELTLLERIKDFWKDNSNWLIIVLCIVGGLIVLVAGGVLFIIFLRMITRPR